MYGARSYTPNILHDPELKLGQVVLMSGSPDLLMPRKGMVEVADGFLAKPFGLQTLLSCISAQFSQF